MPLFEIVFQGQIKAGVAPEQARQRLGQLFQAGDQQLDILFSGRRIVIKQGLDQASADKYRQAIERAGAICLVESVGGQPAAAEPSSEPAPATQSAGNKVVPRDEYMAAFSDVEAPDFGIAPLGADMQDEYRDFTPLPLDLSALSLAPPGADLDEIKRNEPAVVPNIDHLKVVD
ncbi:MAG: hypothetical protein V7772_02815 [Pseudomonas profundi]|uniref:hypothetical protein n=1 Tax=Pseudomonas profundi TaxID=1981513 RepID=UPI0030029036